MPTTVWVCAFLLSRVFESNCDKLKRIGHLVRVSAWVSMINDYDKPKRIGHLVRVSARVSVINDYNRLKKRIGHWFWRFCRFGTLGQSEAYRTVGTADFEYLEPISGTSAVTTDSDTIRTTL